MPSTMDAAAFPAVMEYKLRRIRRRQCVLAITRGAVLAAGALLLGMLIAINIDGWFQLLHTEVRLVLTAATLLLAGSILIITSTRPISSSWKLRAVAEAVDRQVPHLEQRWTTVTHCGPEIDRRHEGPAAAMLRLVTNEAVAMAQLVNPARIATVAHLRRATMWMIGTAVLLGLFLAGDWQHHRVLLQRFWMPLSPISATQITSETGDIVLPRGEPLGITLTLSGIPRNSASLMLIHEDERIENIELQLDSANPTRVAYHLRSLNGSFHYRAQSGDGRSRWYRVTAIDRPALVETRLRLTAPEYVQRPVYEKNYLPQRLNAFAGSRLTLEFRPAEPLSRFELRLDSHTANNPDPQADSHSESRHHLLLAGADGWYRYETILEGDVDLSPILFSPHGLTNEDQEACHIRVIADRSPVVQITYPTEEAAVSPDQVIDVKFEAHDDHGIAQAELVVYRETPAEDEPPAILSIDKIPLEDQQNARYVSAVTQLDLSKYDLSIGSRISYAVRVSDNRPVARPAPVHESDSDEVADPPSPAEPVPSAEFASSDSMAPEHAFAADLSIDSDDLPGHKSESNRLQLKIVQRTVVSSDRSDNRQMMQPALRRRLEQIDGELESAEMLLESIWEEVSSSPLDDENLRELADAEARLAKVDRIIADLRADSKETPYAFVGLQMVDIDSGYITPARDRVFAVIRQPNADAELSIAEANHRVKRARELLAELLARYERAVREQELADSLENAAEIHEVYVADMQRLLRPQSAPSPHPLERSMAILNIDQEYLDRLREVLEMRRDLMAELGRILADDPRLLGKFMDIMKRRQTSLRDQLTRLHHRQLEIAEELAGWQLVHESQREAVWVLAAELRLHEAAQLARDISQFESRTVSQFPLELDPKHRWPAAVIDRVGRLAVQARSVVAKSQRLLADPFDKRIDLVSDVELMDQLLSDLDTALELLESEHLGEETAAFVTNRKAESGALAEQVSAWTETAANIQHQRYHGLAAVDQRRLAIHTEQLRLAMQDVEIQLPGGFRGEIPMPIREIADELKQTIEAVTFNQIAATFGLDQNDLAGSQEQQELALAGFERAEELFDRLRRLVVEELDQTDLDDPNVADLVDPTLDEFLERLEREPDLNALLGIPDRPSNLRRTSDWMQWSERDRSQDDLNASAQRARQRSEEHEKWAKGSPEADEEGHDLTEQQWQEIADADAAQEKIQERVEELRRLAADPDVDEEQAERLRRAAEQLEEMGRQMVTRDIGDEEWRRLVRAEQMHAILAAVARGEPLPDQQWIQILSSLGDGLWQVRRRTPPEGYRKAIEQYQDRISKLRSLEVGGAAQP